MAKIRKRPDVEVYSPFLPIHIFIPLAHQQTIERRIKELTGRRAKEYRNSEFNDCIILVFQVAEPTDVESILKAVKTACRELNLSLSKKRLARWQ